jgi:hypothetical protein
MIDAPVQLDPELTDGAIYRYYISEPLIVKRNVVDIRDFRFWRLSFRDLKDGQPVLRMIPRQELMTGYAEQPTCRARCSTSRSSHPPSRFSARRAHIP